jgi:hypothetical protein
MAALQMKDGGASMAPPKTDQIAGQAPKPQPKTSDKVATR